MLRYEPIRLILASASPRRRELLTGMGVPFRVLTREVDEHLPDGMHPRDGVALLSRRKGEAVLSLAAGAPVLAADTLVEYGGVPLGKPHDPQDALRMLMLLSGQTHRVYTGVSVWFRGHVFTDTDTTEVQFRDFGREEALAYIGTGEPMDKAGAYGIQGQGGALVSGIRGAFDNVVGLPTALVRRLLVRVGYGHEEE